MKKIKVSWADLVCVGDGKLEILRTCFEHFDPKRVANFVSDDDDPFADCVWVVTCQNREVGEQMIEAILNKNLVFLQKHKQAPHPQHPLTGLKPSQINMMVDEMFDKIAV